MNTNVVTILVVILLVFAIAGAPPMGWHSYGWYPSGALGLLLFVLVVVLLIRAGGGTLLVLLAAGLTLSAGCAHTLGYAGKNPGQVKCKGKGSITGTGSMQLGAGVGGGGNNAWTIQADCGDGFEFSQGPMVDKKGNPIIMPTPSE